jgi:hypothetical protein
LPPPLDSLVLELVQQRHGYSTLGRSDDHPWLFPGTAGGQPISSRQLMRKLTALGIKAGPARNTTLMELSSVLPAVTSAVLRSGSRSSAQQGLTTPPNSPVGGLFARRRSRASTTDSSWTGARLQTSCRRRSVHLPIGCVSTWRGSRPGRRDRANGAHRVLYRLDAALVAGR